MAWVEKRQKGYLVRWREPGGKTTSASRRTLDEARALKADMESAIHKGLYVAQETRRLPFAEYAKQVLDADMGLSSTTRENYDRTLRTHLSSLADIPIELVEPGRVRALFGRLKAQGGLSDHVIHMTKKVLSKVCSAAVEDGILQRNPAKAVKAKTPARRELTPLTPEQVAEVADKVAPRWRCAVLLGAWGGLRIGEVGALTKEDLDWERGAVRISKSQSHKGLKSAKTKASERTVVLPGWVMKELAAHVLKYADPQGRLFVTEYGNPINHMTIGPIMRKTGVRFHDLRHTQAALLIKLGAHPKEIQSRLGHANIAVTMNVYGNLFPEADDALARKLEQFDPGELGKVVPLGTASSDK